MKKETTRQIASEIKADIQIPNSPNILGSTNSEILMKKRPLASDIIVANTGFSRAAKYPERRTLKPNIKNENEYILNVLIEQAINSELSPKNMPTIIGAAMKDNIKMNIDEPIMVLKLIEKIEDILCSSFFP